MELNKFLVKAKVNTYASVGESKEIILEDGAKELTYEDGEFKYRDRYYGFSPFVGQEIVWKNNKIVWTMNYYAKLSSDTISPKEFYTFLQKALKQVQEDRPFRGPNNFKEDDLEYVDESTGNVNRFKGTEKIVYKGEEVFQLNYHGGSME
jgi:hypothetical protein